MGVGMQGIAGSPAKGGMMQPRMPGMQGQGGPPAEIPSGAGFSKGKSAPPAAEAPPKAATDSQAAAGDAGLHSAQQAAAVTFAKGKAPGVFPAAPCNQAKPETDAGSGGSWAPSGPPAKAGQEVKSADANDPSAQQPHQAEPKAADLLRVAVFQGKAAVPWKQESIKIESPQTLKV